MPLKTLDPNGVPMSQREQSLTATFVDISFKLSRGLDDSLLHRVTGKVSMDDGGIYAIMGPLWRRKNNFIRCDCRPKISRKDRWYFSGKRCQLCKHGISTPCIWLRSARR